MRDGNYTSLSLQPTGLYILIPTNRQRYRRLKSNSLLYSVLRFFPHATLSASWCRLVRHWFNFTVSNNTVGQVIFSMPCSGVFMSHLCPCGPFNSLPTKINRARNSQDLLLFTIFLAKHTIPYIKVKGYHKFETSVICEHLSAINVLLLPSFTILQGSNNNW